MGFPRIEGYNGTNSGGNTTTSNVDIATLGFAPTTGDLLIITITKDGTGAFTWPGSPAFTQCSNYPLAVGGAAAAIHDARYRVSTGNETTCAITHSTESTAWEVIRIAAGTWGGLASANTAPASATVAGDSTNADPPNLAPAAWTTVENTLWIATAGWDGQPTNTAGPSSYILFRTDLVAASTGSRVAIAVRELAASSENPGVFTSGTEQWAAGTIAVMPNTARSFPQPVVMVRQAVNRAATY